VTPDLKWLNLTRDESNAFDRALDALTADLAFEHLDRRSAEQLVWRLACQAELNRRTDHVLAFIAAHAREPTSLKSSSPFGTWRSARSSNLAM